MIKRRLRTLLLSRLLGGDLKKWLIYFAAMSGLRTARKIWKGEPELLYQATFGPGSHLGMLTDKPLPRHLRSRKLRKAIAAQASAELGG